MEKNQAHFKHTDAVVKDFLDDFMVDEDDLLVEEASDEAEAQEQEEEAEQEQEEASDEAQEQEEEEEQEQEEGQEWEVDSRITEALTEFYDQPIESGDDILLAIDRAKEKLRDTTAQLEQESQVNAQLAQVLEQSPDLTKVIQGLMSGRHFLEVLEEVVGDINDLTPDPVESPEEYAKYMRSKVQREIELENERKQAEARQKQIEDNKTQTLKIIDDFQKTKKIDSVKRDEFLSKIDSTINDALDGKLTAEFLEMMWKGMNYDVDVVKAQAQAKIEGRNEGIVAAKQKKVGDGVPRVKRGATPSQKQTVTDDFDRGFLEAATNRNRFSNL